MKMNTELQNSTLHTHSRRDTLLIAALIGLAFLLRLTYAWPTLTGEKGFWIGDDDDYHRLAVSIISGGPLGYDGQPSAYRMPLFPLFLGGIYMLLGPSPAWAQAVIVALSTLNVILAYIIGRQLGSARAGLIGALLSAINADHIFFAGVLLTETLCMTLLTACMLAIVRLHRSGGNGWACIVGILIGLTLLTRVNMIVIAPIGAGWLLRYGHGTVRSRLVHITIILATCVAIWGAWIARNYLALQTFIPLTTQSGSGYYGVFNDLAAAPQSIQHFGGWRYLEYTPQIAAAQTEVERDRIQRQIAIDWIRTHPTQSILIMLAQIYQFWSSTTDFPLHPLYLALAAVGIGILWRRHSREGMLWLMAGLALTAIAPISLAVPRFNVPLLPGLTACIGIALEQGWLLLRQPRRVALLAPSEADTTAP